MFNDIQIKEIIERELMEDINRENIKKITSLVIDKDKDFIDLSDLEKLDNLRELHLNGLNLFIENIETLNKLNIETLILNSCVMSSFPLSNPYLHTLYLINTNMENVYDINEMHLDNLTIEMLDDIDLSLLNLTNIKSLTIRNTTILKEEYLIYLDKIEYLDLTSTNVKDLSVCLTFDTIKTVVMDDMQIASNKKYYEMFKSKNIKVINIYGIEV